MSTPVRADLAPPGRAEVVIELTLQNQAAFPDLRFVVVDCWPALPPGLGFARGAEPIRCLPRDPLSVYAVARAEFERISTNPAPADALTAIMANGKSCGVIAPSDTQFGKETGLNSALVTYAIDAPSDGSCTMHKVSLVTETAEQRRARESGLTASSASGGPSEDTSPRPRSRGCGSCAMTSDGPSAPATLILAVALLSVLRRAQGRRRADAHR